MWLNFLWKNYCGYYVLHSNKITPEVGIYTIFSRIAASIHKKNTIKIAISNCKNSIKKNITHDNFIRSYSACISGQSFSAFSPPNLFLILDQTSPTPKDENILSIDPELAGQHWRFPMNVGKSSGNLSSPFPQPIFRSFFWLSSIIYWAWCFQWELVQTFFLLTIIAWNFGIYHFQSLSSPATQ